MGSSCITVHRVLFLAALARRVWLQGCCLSNRYHGFQLFCPRAASQPKLFRSLHSSTFPYWSGSQASRMGVVSPAAVAAQSFTAARQGFLGSTLSSFLFSQQHPYLRQHSQQHPQQQQHVIGRGFMFQAFKAFSRKPRPNKALHLTVCPPLRCGQPAGELGR